MKQIALYHRLSLICLGGMILCACVTLFIYKKLNIRAVICFFWRNRKQKKRVPMIVLWGMLCCSLTMPVMAAQVEQEKQEEIKDSSPILESFSICPGSEETENAFTTEDGITFYARNLEKTEDIQIKVTIRDEREKFDESSVLFEYRTVGLELWTVLSGENQVWNSCEEGVFETSYAFDGVENAEFIYEFRIGYVDTAGNAMILGENVSAEESGGESGTFVSTQKIVIDKVSPVYEAVYLDESGETLQSDEKNYSINPYYNAAKEVTLNFNVTEKNLDYEKTTVKIISSDIKGIILNEERLEIADEQIQTVLKSDGHYKVEIHLLDKAGNKTIHEKKFALDYEPPKKPVITYTAENTGLLERMINQLTFGYFAKEKIVAHIQVEDSVSGVEKITYTYEDVDREDAVTETLEETDGKIEVKLPFSFKGDLKVYSEDLVGNVSEEFQDIGVIAESEETHKEVSATSVKVLGKHSKTPNYYAGDVAIKFAAKDTYSGIKSISYLAGQGLNETVCYIGETDLVTEEVVKEYRISASENNMNNIPIGLTFKDNAGYETTVPAERLPKIHIDTVGPKVRVVYDNYDADNGKYYRESRTATVYVAERNFDPDDVEFDISGPSADISSWSHTAGDGCAGSSDPAHTGHSDTCVWKCEITFEEDGDYRFGFSCIDMCGNEGSYDKVDEFVIDKTAPVIRVTYDNYDVRNEIYYHAPRIAQISVTERNFQPDDVMISISAENEGQVIGSPAISGWTTIGDTHHAVITYNYDGVFSFDIVYEDLAGNEAADYTGDYFVIDLTKPEIIISEVKDKSANNGSVSPLITVTDVNYQAGSGWFELSGWQNGIVDTAKAAVSIRNGDMIRIQDFAHTEEMDDLYRLKAGAADMAGNVSEVQISFSINRFGSVYTLDETTEKLTGENGTYYTDEEKRLVVTETNVDTLLFKEIVCSLNGKLRTLKEGTDYTVQETGDETSWKQYRYEIKESNFTEEGHYTLTIYSEDRANNTSNNQSKGKSISFAVDKSAPSILISGVEDQGQYRENSREIMLDVQDNIALAEVQVLLDGTAQVFDMTKLQAVNGKLNLTAGSKNDWQTLTVYGVDRAGNEMYTEKITFLVTPNLFVQFYQNTGLFYGSMIFLSVCVSSVIILIMKRESINSSKSS